MLEVEWFVYEHQKEILQEAERERLAQTVRCSQNAHRQPSVMSTLDSLLGHIFGR